jgi:ligand-binding sensor domain-containing protein
MNRGSTLQSGVEAVAARRFPVWLHFLAAVTARAQQLSVRHYDASDGLVHNHVGAIHQDRKGYLWFATWEGLSRFDGHRFTNYGEREGLKHAVVNDITEDRRGRLWVATNGGGGARLLDDPRENMASGPFKPTGAGRLAEVRQLSPVRFRRFKPGQRAVVRRR